MHDSWLDDTWKYSAEFNENHVSAMWVGPTQSLDDIKQLLIEPLYRLVTITGAGGIGKTFLAAKVAADLRLTDDGIPRDVLIISLASATRDQSILRIVAQQLKSPATDSEGVPLETLHTVIGSRPLTVILDGCEHVVASAHEIGALLNACSGVKVLATSRIPLGLPTERLYRMRPLPQTQVLMMLQDRLKSKYPDFEISKSNLECALEIGEALDNLPLALELVAFQFQRCDYDIEVLRSRLHRALPMLEGVSTGLPTRQRSMRASLDWDYSLLSMRQQVLFRQLAVFEPGTTRWAITEVVNIAETGRGNTSLGAVRKPLVKDMAEDLLTLEQLGLLVVDRSFGGEPRYHLSKLAREYAYGILSDSPELAIVSRKHLAYYLQLAERAYEKIEQGRPPTNVMGLSGEHENIIAAVKTAFGLEQGYSLALLVMLLCMIGKVDLVMATVYDMALRCPGVPKDFPIRFRSIAAHWLAAHGDVIKFSELTEEILGLINREAGGQYRYGRSACRLLLMRILVAWENKNTDDVLKYAKAALSFAKIVKAEDYMAIAEVALAYVSLIGRDPEFGKDKLDRVLARSEKRIKVSRYMRVLWMAGLAAGEVMPRQELRTWLELKWSPLEETEDTRGIVVGMGQLAAEYAQVLSDELTITHLGRVAGSAITLLNSLPDARYLKGAQDDNGEWGMVEAHFTANRERLGGAWNRAVAEGSGRTPKEVFIDALLALAENPTKAEESVDDEEPASDNDPVNNDAVENSSDPSTEDEEAPEPARANRSRGKGATIVVGGKEVDLTKREVEVVTYIAQGLKDAEIAAKLYISYRTATNHAQSVFDKLGASNRANAASIWTASQQSAQSPGANARQQDE